MPTSTVTSKGQTTIPKTVRERLHLHAGDRVEFVIQDDRTVLLKPATIDVTALKGILRRAGAKPVSVQRMKHVIAQRFRRTP